MLAKLKVIYLKIYLWKVCLVTKYVPLDNLHRFGLFISNTVVHVFMYLPALVESTREFYSHIINIHPLRLFGRSIYVRPVGSPVKGAACKICSVDCGATSTKWIINITVSFIFLFYLKSANLIEIWLQFSP